MKTYTKEEQRRNLEGACKALEANPKKAINGMRDKHGGRCCLCVMEDYARSINPEIKKGGSGLPHSDLAEFYGIDNHIQAERSFDFAFSNDFLASQCNDGDGAKEHTHKEIAARIRKDFLA